MEKLEKGKGKEIVFFNGEFLSESEAKISVKTHAFHYGTGIFEGIRSFWNKTNQTHFILALREHCQRLVKSCQIMKFSLSYSLEDLIEIIINLLEKNLEKEEYRQDLYIRPIVYLAEEKIGVKITPEMKIGIVIFAIPFGSYFPDEENVRAMVSSWRRISDNAIPSRAKCCGAYVNSALAKTEALSRNFDEAILLNENGKVAEASAANLFIVREGEVITPPVTDNILEGITRKIVIQLVKEELSLPIIERSIDRTELYGANEIFITGTACNISAITEVDFRKVGNGKIGPITKRLREIYFEICQGKNPKYFYLLTPVTLKIRKTSYGLSIRWI